MSKTPIKSKQARGWILTINAPPEGVTEASMPEFIQRQLAPRSPVYAIFAQEEAPSTGHVHWHGVVRFPSAVRGSVLLKFFPGAHIDSMALDLPNVLRCISYVTKGGRIIYKEGQIPSEVAKKPKPKTQKEEFDEVIQEIKQQKQLTSKISESYVYARNQRFLDQFICKQACPDIWDGELLLKNIWIWGPPGTGKSSLAWDFITKNGLTVYVKNQNKWWDGYNGQQVILIEDVSPDKMKVLTDHMKVWGDRYPFTMEIKGSSQFCHSPTFYFIVTSNYTIDQCFSSTDVGAIKRRFFELEIDELHAYEHRNYTDYEKDLLRDHYNFNHNGDSIKDKLLYDWLHYDLNEPEEQEATTLVIEPEEISIEVKEEWKWQTLPSDQSHHFDEEKEVEEPPRSQAPPPPSPPQRTKTRELPPTPSIDPSIQIEEDLRRWDAMFFPEMAQKTPSKEDK